MGYRVGEDLGEDEEVNEEKEKGGVLEDGSVTMSGSTKENIVGKDWSEVEDADREVLLAYNMGEEVLPDLCLLARHNVTGPTISYYFPFSF